MQEFHYLNPFFNHGILFCGENILVVLSIVSLILGIYACFRGVENFRSVFGVILACQLEILLIRRFPFMYPHANQDPFWFLILCFVLFWIEMSIFIKLSFLLCGYLKRILHIGEPTYPQQGRVLFVVLFGLIVVVYNQFRLGWFNSSLNLVFGVVLFLAGVFVQNSRMRQKPIFYPTYPDLLRLKRGDIDEKE